MYRNTQKIIYLLAQNYKRVTEQRRGEMRNEKQIAVKGQHIKNVLMLMNGMDDLGTSEMDITLTVMMKYIKGE